MAQALDVPVEIMLVEDLIQSRVEPVGDTAGQIPRVPVKSVTQQALVGVHRVREQWMTTRTARINVLRGLLREQGVLLPAIARGAIQAVPSVLDDPDAPLPAPLRHALRSVYEEVRDLEDRIEQLEAELKTLATRIPSSSGCAAFWGSAC